jgi:multimeric flavodoxin WrbA
MKVLGISGSPRKGNTEWMLTKLLEFLDQDNHITELVLIRKMSIKNCTGCLACEAGGKERKGLCTINDDMQLIYPKMLEADVIVLGSPVYFDMISGLLKNFMDRTCPIWTKLGGKRLVGIAVAEESIGKAVDNLKTYGAICGMEWAGSVTAIASKPTDASKDKRLESTIRKLSAAII